MNIELYKEVFRLFILLYEKIEKEKARQIHDNYSCNKDNNWCYYNYVNNVHDKDNDSGGAAANNDKMDLLRIKTTTLITLCYTWW